jgi:hypothetical protein
MVITGTVPSVVKKDSPHLFRTIYYSVPMILIINADNFPKHHETVDLDNGRGLYSVRYGLKFYI